MTDKLYGNGRAFDTGATRDTADNKPDFEGCLSPAVLESFAQYMLRSTKLADGTTRSSDNWQKGIPIDVYMKSLLRHTFEMWISHRKGVFNREATDGAFFNLQGFYHEQLKARAEQGRLNAYEAAGDELKEEYAGAGKAATEMLQERIAAAAEKLANPLVTAGGIENYCTPKAELGPQPPTLEEKIAEVSPEKYGEILDKWFEKNVADDEELVIQKKP